MPTYDNDLSEVLDRRTSGGLLDAEDSLSYRVAIIGRHLHNYGRFWGAVAAPDEANAIEANVDRPFVVVSGNNTWGTAIPICGTGDMPVPAGCVKFDPHFLLITEVDHATPYRFRLIHGTGTSADAIAAGQWSEIMLTVDTGPFTPGKAVEVLFRRVDVGEKMWAQVWNATDGSNVDFFWGCHGYIG